MPIIDARGRVTLPKSLRDSLSVRPGDKLLFTQTTEGWMLQRAEDATPGRITAQRLGFMRELGQVPDDFDTLGSDDIQHQFEGAK